MGIYLKVPLPRYLILHRSDYKKVEGDEVDDGKEGVMMLGVRYVSHNEPQASVAQANLSA